MRHGSGHHSGTPGRVILAALAVVLAWLAIGGVGGPAVGNLSALQKNNNSAFLPGDAESTKAADIVARMTSTTTLPLIVVGARSRGLSPGDLAIARTFAASIPRQRLPLGSGATIGDYLTRAPVATVPSTDGKAFLIIVPLDGEKVSTAVGGTTPVAAIGERLRGAVATDLRTRGLTAYVTGPAGFISDLVNAFKGIDGILLLVALGVVLVILLLVYRSPVLPFAVLLTSTFGLSAAGLVVYRVAERGWITVSGQSQGILSILVIGASTDYALLLVSRYREELREQESPWLAMRRAWRATAVPIVASAATVILGLLALTLASLNSTSSLGPVGALGILGALLSALTFLPAILVLGRRWVLWPSIPHVDHVHRADALESSRGWGRVAAFVGRRARATWVVTALVLLVAASFLPSLKADGIAESDVFLTKVDSVKGQALLAEHFDAGSGSPLEVVAAPAKAAEVAAILGREKGLASPFLGLTPGGPAPVVDGHVLLQATLAEAADSPSAADTVRRVRTDVRAVDPTALVGGQTAQALDVRTAAQRDLRVVAPAIIAVVFLVLVLLLRALIAPLILILANVLSFAATMGVSALVFNHVFHFPGGDPTTVLYGFVFLVALGVDYSIFLMTRAREETARVGPRRGTLIALAVTGGVITSAGIVLASTFAALSVLPLLFLAQIAFIVAFGVLLDTLVVRSLLVPALSFELGRWTWWPGRLAGRVDDAR